MSARLDVELERRLLELERSELRRRERVAPAAAQVFCSNDYLGLAASDVVRVALSDAAHGTVGSGASRLVSGTTSAHQQLERAVAAWLGVDAALVFGSGYAANVGLLSALLTERDAVFSDELNHASLIDGIRLSRARRHVFRHRDFDQLREQLRACDAPGLRVVVTESVFSMDGDVPDLVALCSVAAELGAVVVVDEAHALGVRGPAGRGVVAELGLDDAVAVRVGTFGKSFGTAGAFVAGSAPLREWLYNRARSFVYSTAPPPPLMAATQAALVEVAAGQRQRVLWTRIEQLAGALAAAGLWRGAPASAVFPVLVGDAARAVALAAELDRHGFFVQAIRPPTVPHGTARLRITVTAAHEPEQIDHLVTTLVSSLSSLHIPLTPSSHD